MQIKNSEILETVKNNITRGLEQFDKMAIDRNIEIWRPIADYPKAKELFGEFQNACEK